MNKPIKAKTFIDLFKSKLDALPLDCRIKSIGTNQDNFIVLLEAPNGREYKLYIRCEAMIYDT